MNTSEIKEALQHRGWFTSSGLTEGEAKQIACNLGIILHETQVIPNPQSRALVTSERALGPHTDHHRARYIMWYCHQPALNGGESVLIDSYEVIDSMSSDEINQLENLRLKEHKVFADDEESRPMLVMRPDGKFSVYYSFWLADDPAPEAFHSFRKKVDALQPVQLALKTGDILLIDNHRMLHGRTAITPGSARHLLRLWIEPSANV
jgi:hypothetical protein